MDPITLIVMALGAGLGSALQDETKGAVKAAYERLRNLVRKRLDGHPDGELALDRHEKAPQKWESVLKDELAEVGAEHDVELTKAAQELMDLVDAAGSRAGKYNVKIQNAQGVQVGDRNTQTNTFTS